MNTLVIIPARLESSRLANKVLLDIGGQSMLQRVWTIANSMPSMTTYITTDNPQIAAHAERFGAEVLMSRQHQSGTDRIAEVIDQLPLGDDDLVINLQADEPLMPTAVLNELAKYAMQQTDTVCSVYSELTDPIKIVDPNCVKVVCDQNNRALYFSRQSIPSSPTAYRMHHGLYAYRVSLLKTWPSLQPGPLEQAEKLEQLRLLENGYSIAMLASSQTIPAGVDTDQDLQQVRVLLTQQKAKDG